MALSIATAIRPALTVYDVMDDLSSFRFAPEELKLRQRQAIRAADIVFTGGRTLHAGVLTQRQQAVHCFPSGVDIDHYRPAAARRRARPLAPPVAGYVGVIDERLDLELLADLADRLPDWEIRMVGPVVKISESDLPRRPNLRYVGPVTYDDLPDTMAGFDVGLMPFALNDATRSISPTKSLEYLAAGLPVVSTRIRDVVTDLSAVVELRRRRRRLRRGLPSRALRAAGPVARAGPGVAPVAPLGPHRRRHGHMARRCPHGAGPRGVRMRFAIAGAGFSGAVIARELAEAGHRVDVFEHATTSPGTATPSDATTACSCTCTARTSSTRRGATSGSTSTASVNCGRTSTG